jgi:Tol biopolymer transport system component
LGEKSLPTYFAESSAIREVFPYQLLARGGMIHCKGIDCPLAKNGRSPNFAREEAAMRIHIRRFLVCFVIAQMLITLGCGAGTGLVTVDPHVQSTPLPTSQPTPTLEAIAYPTSAVAGGVGFSLTVTGRNFIPTSIILWNGLPRPTDHPIGNSNTLTATISAADIVQPGIVRISVENPGGGSLASATSGTMNFPILTFHLSSLSPASVAEGSGSTDLELIGAGFIPTAVVFWNGSPRSANFVSDTKLVVPLTAQDLAVAGVAELHVVIGSGTGETSNTLVFPIASNSLGPMERVSLGDSNQETTVASSLPTVSFDASIVSFVQGDVDHPYKVISRNTCLGGTLGCVAGNTVVSLNTLGTEISTRRTYTVPSLTADGRFVALASDMYGAQQISFTQLAVRDTCFGAVAPCVPSTLLPSQNVGRTSNTVDSFPAFSADGRYLAYTTGDDGGYGFDSAEVVLYDTCRGASGNCSPSYTGLRALTSLPEVYAQTSRQSLSADGRYLVFGGILADNASGLWLVDTCLGAIAPCTMSTDLVSVDAQGKEISAVVSDFAVSAGGRYVAFSVFAMNGVFIRDTCAGSSSACTPTTNTASLSSNGSPLSGAVGQVSISADGRFVAFVESTFDSLSRSVISNVLARDTCIGIPSCVARTILVSSNQSGAPANGTSRLPVISGDGRYVVFESDAADLVPNDKNGVRDVFRRRIF